MRPDARGCAPNGYSRVEPAPFRPTAVCDPAASGNGARGYFPVRRVASRGICLLFRAVGRLAPQLPPRVGYAVFGAFGTLAFRVNRHARQAVACNWGHVLGGEASSATVDRQVRATFANLGRNYYDLFRLPSLSGEDIAGAVMFRGWEYLASALRVGRGVVLTSIHGCGVETVLAAMALRGIPVTVLVERIDPPEMLQFITAVRACRGLRVIPAGDSMIGLWRALERGEVVGIAADRDVTGSGLPTTLFGAPAALPRGHVRLAGRTGAPLLFCWCRRKGFGEFEATFSSAVLVSPEPGDGRDSAAAMRFVASEMETAIRACPEQWLMTTAVWGDG